VLWKHLYIPKQGEDKDIKELKWKNKNKKTENSKSRFTHNPRFS
jgi:hypothetical protein